MSQENPSDQTPNKSNLVSTIFGYIIRFFKAYYTFAFAFIRGTKPNQSLVGVINAEEKTISFVETDESVSYRIMHFAFGFFLLTAPALVPYVHLQNYNKKQAAIARKKFYNENKPKIEQLKKSVVQKYNALDVDGVKALLS
jgi:hypothetical protein